MPNIRLLDTDHYRTAALSLATGTEAAGLPVEASQDPDRSHVFRSIATPGVVELDIDLGAVTPVSACAMANVGLLGIPDAGVVELYELGDGASPGAATLIATFATQDVERRTAVVFFTEESHRHWRLTWTNPGGSSVAELGFATLGTYTEPAVNVSVPLSMSEVDPSVVRRAIDRQRRTVARTRFLAGTWTWHDVNDTDRADLEAMFRTIGTRLPVFMTLDTARTWTTILGYLGPSFGQTFGELDGLYNLSVPWEEAT